MLELLGVALFLRIPTAPSCVTVDRRVEAVIAEKRWELRAEEYCQFRSYETLSDVDGDRVNDFLVVFALEGVGGGGNSAVQFLVVFPSGSQWQPVIAEVGRRGQRIVQSIQRGPGRVTQLETLEYWRSDAMCCPTRKTTLRLALTNGELRSAEE